MDSQPDLWYNTCGRIVQDRDGCIAPDQVTGGPPPRPLSAGMVTVMMEQVIRDAVRCLGQAAPGATVILFGSAARGKMTSGSDLDFLVVMPTVTHHASEMARLRAALQPVIGPHFIPADVLVASQAEYEHWQDTPGTVYYEAAHSGYVLAPAA